MLLFTLFACLSDIRPASVPLGENAELDAKGRALLMQAADAHGGLDTWKAKQTTELLFTDAWNGMYTYASPWPDDIVHTHVMQRTHTFDSRVRFLEGVLKDTTWGIEDGNTYTIDAAGEKTVSPNADADFMLPTVHYFIDMPFRLTEAPLQRYGGRQTVQGKEYDVVFATWETLEKNRTYDQYVVFLNPDSHLVEKVQYTVRDVAGFVTAAAHFQDVKDVDGIRLAHTMVVNDGPDQSTDSASHVMTLKAARYDSFDKSTWSLKPGLSSIVP